MGKLYSDLKIKQTTLIQVVRRNKHGHAIWECKCSCGKVFERSEICISRSLKTNYNMSCGCIKGTNKGKQFSDEWKRNISKANIGKQNALGKRRTELSQKYPENYGKTNRGSYATKLITEIKCKARQRKKAWNLNDLEAFELCLQPCYYCGLEVSFPESRNGIDRIDNSKGYESENVVSCCKWCNSAKMERTLEEFKDWITKAYNKIV